LDYADWAVFLVGNNETGDGVCFHDMQGFGGKFFRSNRFWVWVSKFV
jgi:hypothetical protein